MTEDTLSRTVVGEKSLSFAAAVKYHVPECDCDNEACVCSNEDDHGAQVMCNDCASECQALAALISAQVEQPLKLENMAFTGEMLTDFSRIRNEKELALVRAIAQRWCGPTLPKLAITADLFKLAQRAEAAELALTTANAELEKLRQASDDNHAKFVEADKAAIASEERLAAANAEADKLRGERDRQYEANISLIAQARAFELETDKLRQALKEAADQLALWEVADKWETSDELALVNARALLATPAQGGRATEVVNKIAEEMESALQENLKLTRRAQGGDEVKK